jgi:RNA polymerase sigma-70 factor (ECF subfamily)
MTLPSGQKDRFLQHFTGSESALRGFIASAIFTPSDRDDILQEVALRLWQLYDRYDPSRPFTPWALGVASRRIKEECRKASRRPLLLEEAHLERMVSAFSELTAREEYCPETALTECLATLPAAAAELIQERYFKGHSVEALSQAKGQSTAAIYQTLCRLRRRLAACIRARLAPDYSPSSSANHVS